MKTIRFLIFAYCSLWAATAYLGTKAMDASFDKTLVAPKVSFEKIDAIDNFDDLKSLKSVYKGSWAYRDSIAVAPFIIYYKNAFFTKQLGGYSTKGIKAWFVLFEYDLWKKRQWIS